MMCNISIVSGVQQIWPLINPPEDSHWGETLQVPLLPLQRLQEGHDHQVMTNRNSLEGESPLHSAVLRNGLVQSPFMVGSWEGLIEWSNNGKWVGGVGINKRLNEPSRNISVLTVRAWQSLRWLSTCRKVFCYIWPEFIHLQILQF